MLIAWKDVVNKTDQTLVFEPGESIEVEIKMVGDELRLESVPGDVDFSAYPIGDYDREAIAEDKTDE